ncbi:MAG: cell division protein FtsQ/DivIB [Pseudonocardiaceae bacterium]
MSTRGRQARARTGRGQRRPGGNERRSVRGRRPDVARKHTADAPGRRKALLRRWLALLIVLTVLGLGYLLLFTSLLGVRSVEVTGVKRVSAAEVIELARIPDRHAMLRVDTDGVERRVVSLHEVRAVEVSRSWPSTITIEVTERSPVAYFRAHDGIWLVDAYGVPFHKQSKKPRTLPELELTTVSSSDPTTRAVTAVLTGLPDRLRKRVTEVGAKTPGSVELTLSNGKKVRWGDAGQLERKSKVLAALLTRPGDIYDVSSPELPTVS